MNNNGRDLEKLDRINVLNPTFTSLEKTEALANFCNESYLDWRHLLEMAISEILNELFDPDLIDDQLQYSRCIELAEQVAIYIEKHVATERLRFRGLCYLLKPMVLTMQQLGYEKHFSLQPSLQVSYFTPVTESQKVIKFRQVCKENEITPLEIMDVAISWFGVDEAMADYSHIKGEGLLDVARLGSGAATGKLVSGYLKYLKTRPFERIVTTMLLVKVGSVSRLGLCPQKLRGLGSSEIS